jgi:uncharacterized membrane protein YhfC
MVLMLVTAIMCFVIPIVLLIVFRIKGADILPFFIGCAVFIVFAHVIEGAINFGVSLSPLWEKISGNVFLYGIYGGLMAGLFEETGRFIAFKTVLKKRLGNDKNALMYGAGHGGIEAIMVVGLSYITYIVMIPLFKSGMLTESMPPEAMEQVVPMLEKIVSTPSTDFLFAIFERVLAISAHIALSVLVWFAAKRRDRAILYPAAILLHAAFDFIAVIASNYLPIWATEAILAVITAALLIIAAVVWKKSKEVPADASFDLPAEQADE